MIPGGEMRVSTRYWSNGHGAGRVTAKARGVQRTVSVDPVTSGGMTLDGTHGEAVAALLAALNLAGVTVPDTYAAAGKRRVYTISTTTTTERNAR